MILHINEIKLKKIKSDISNKREEWRNVREIRLNKKNELLDGGLIIKEVRKQKEYCQLKREQKQLSKEIKHLEKKYNFMLAAGNRQ